MPRAKKAGRRRDPPDPLDAYRRIRKPVPPPGRPIEDRRRELEDEEAERQIRDRE